MPVISEYRMMLLSPFYFMPISYLIYALIIPQLWAFLAKWTLSSSVYGNSSPSMFKKIMDCISNIFALSFHRIYRAEHIIFLSLCLYLIWFVNLINWINSIKWFNSIKPIKWINWIKRINSIKWFNWFKRINRYANWQKSISIRIGCIEK